MLTVEPLAVDATDHGCSLRLSWLDMPRQHRI